jgi:hypothetical protein
MLFRTSTSFIAVPPSPERNRAESNETAAIKLTKAENRYVSNPDDSLLKIIYMFNRRLIAPNRTINSSAIIAPVAINCAAANCTSKISHPSVGRVEDRRHHERPYV